MWKYKTHVYYSFSAPLLGCRDSDWCHQFCYLMFNLLIVQLFEKCVFVLRTELMLWDNGPAKISYIMFKSRNCNTRFLPNSAIRFCDRHLLNDFMLLFGPIWQKGLYPRWKWNERSENRITKQLRDESQTYPDGIRFLRGLLNKPRSSISDSQTNVNTIS